MCVMCNIKDTDPRVIWSNSYVIAMWDSYPVNKGHCIIFSRSHYARWADVPWDIKNSYMIAVDFVRNIINDAYSPAAYNIGINDGRAAGQTIDHCHMHIIPRYHGDCENPRGGIRHCVMNGLGDY